MAGTNAEAGVERREQIVKFLRAYIRKHGHSPTVRDVAAGVGLSSSHTTHKHLEKLVEEGRVERLQVTAHRFVYVLADE